MQNRRVLIVEDEPQIAAVIAHKLGKAGLKAQSVFDAGQALRRLQAERFDLVLIDLHLPGMSGGELVKALALDPATRALPILIITGTPFRPEPADLGSAMVRGVLPKPFSPSELLTLVQNALDDQARARAA
jgi:CheY-like chemotaxis protein